MKLFFIPFFLLFSVNIWAQNDAVKIGILPAIYAEGMPVEEYKKFENNVIRHLVKLERYDVVRNKGAYKNIDTDGGLGILQASIKQEGKNVTVPYLFQLRFGDTEWVANAEVREQKNTVTIVDKTKDNATTKTPAKTSRTPGSTKEPSPLKPSSSKTTNTKTTSTRPSRNESTTPSKTVVPSVWTQNATMWVTLNLYEVATGQLLNTITVKASSLEFYEFKKASAKYRGDFKNAASAAQKSTWKKVKQAIKKLYPLQLTIKDIIDKKDDKVLNVSISGGTFHGLEVKDKIYVYYEKEYEVRGQKKMRHVEVAKLGIEAVTPYTSTCKVKKGGKDITEALAAGHQLKCTVPLSGFVQGYGF